MTQLLQIRVSPDTEEAERTEVVEAGNVSTVVYGHTEFVTTHGLRLLHSDLGMESALDLLQRNADDWGWPILLETPPELYAITDCSGLIIRPQFFDYEACLWWVQREGANLISYFGHGCRFAFMPELYRADHRILADVTRAEPHVKETEWAI